MGGVFLCLFIASINPGESLWLWVVHYRVSPSSEFNAVGVVTLPFEEGRRLFCNIKLLLFGLDVRNYEMAPKITALLVPIQVDEVNQNCCQITMHLLYIINGFVQQHKETSKHIKSKNVHSMLLQYTPPLHYHLYFLSLSTISNKAHKPTQNTHTHTQTVQLSPIAFTML